MSSTPPQVKNRIEQKTLEKSASVTLNLWGRIKRVWFRWADMNQHAAWFPFFIGGIVGLDAIIILLPGDVIVALAILSNPQAWRKTMLSAGLGSAIGAILLYIWILNTGGDYLGQLREANEAIGLSASWEKGAVFFQQRGPFSLFIGSLIPGASWAPVVLAGLSSAPAGPVIFYLITGRLLRYFLFCYGIRYGWAFFQTIRSQAKEEREAALRADEESKGQ